MNSLRLGSSYLLHEPIGRGAMGQVWRGSLVSDGSPVAVKVLRPELAEDADVVARFHREGSIMVAIRHPCVVGIREVVAEGETLAIVMDLIEGGDLRAYLRAAGSLPPSEALRLTGQVLAGLQAVHSAGILHRDLKPENILIDLSGTTGPVARLTDFGIARFTEGPTMTRLTGVIGTPQYLPPEVIAHGRASTASDLYSAGIVLYELLSGQVPFAAPHPAAVLRQHLEDSPKRPDCLAEDVWDFVSSLLDKDPAGRMASASDAAQICASLAVEHRGAGALLAAPGRSIEEQATFTPERLNAASTRDPEPSLAEPVQAAFRASPSQIGGQPSKTWRRRRLVPLVASLLVLTILYATSDIWRGFLPFIETDETADLAVIVTPDALLGWWSDGRWVEAGSSRSAPVRKGEEYLITSLKGTRKAVGSAAESTCVAIPGTLGVEMAGLDYPDQGPPPVAVSGVKDPIPRPIRILDPEAGAHAERIRSFLTESAQSQAAAEARIVEALEVDVDNDGNVEMIVVVENLSEEFLDPPPPEDFSFVILLSDVNGLQQASVIESGAIPHRIASIADLNGDGRMEIAVAYTYHEGQGVIVYDIRQDGSIARILGGGCGI